MRISYLAILIAFLGLQTGAAQATPIPTYNIIDCSVTQSVCEFGPVSSGAPPGSAQPTAADFQSFYYDNYGINAPANTYFWDEKASNSAGIELGYVGSNYLAAFDTQYIWNGNEIICCIIDYPYSFTGINDNGLIIGSNLYQYDPNLLSPAFIGLPDGPFEADQFPIQLTPQAAAFVNSLYVPGIGTNITFDAIDDKDRIEATDGRDFLLFVPVPEPPSFPILLVGLGLIGGAFYFGRKKSQPA